MLVRGSTVYPEVITDTTPIVPVSDPGVGDKSEAMLVDTPVDVSVVR